jgi:hypothetical protein
VYSFFRCDAVGSLLDEVVMGTEVFNAIAKELKKRA